MTEQRFSQYTSKWTNIPVSKVEHRQLLWLTAHKGGQYHIHESGTRIKFERTQDAEWFILRWL
jgi:hypothetical protein